MPATVNSIVHIAVGTAVLGSLWWGINKDKRAFYVTAFMGANLVQMGFTNWCPLAMILRSLDVPDPESCGNKPGCTCTLKNG